MHPDKFLRRAPAMQPVMSDAERLEKLEDLGRAIAEKRTEAVEARKASGIEDIWLKCEEAYLGIDDMNRHEFAEAKWAKPTSMQGPLTSNKVPNDDVRSNVFVRLTSRYVDQGSAKLGEILLPIDEKAFAFEPTPIPDLVKQMEDLTPLIDAATGQQVTRPAKPEEMPQGQAPGQPQPQVPMTVADQAQQEADQAAEAAEKAEKRVYDWMIESKYPAEMRKVIKDAARLGTGILKGPFPDKRKSKALTKVQDGIALQIQEKVVPALAWKDPWNFFPADGCGENIHDGDYVFERDFLSKRALKKLKTDPTYLPEQIDRVLEEGPGKIYLEGANPNDRNTKKRFEIWYYYGTLSRDELSLAIADKEMLDDLPEGQDDVFAIVSMVNDTVVRAILNPLDSGRFPYHVMCWARRAGLWAGVGVGEQMFTPQRMCNASTRALLNNAGLSAGPQIIIDQIGVIPADGSWKLTPNKVWYKTEESSTPDVRQAFFAVDIPNVQQQMMAIIEYSMKLAEEATGIPLVTQGQDGETSPQTFGQAELQNTNAHTWLRSIGYGFDDQITEPVVNDLYEWLLLDPSVPDDEKGDFRINAHGSVAMVERAIQEQVFLSLLQASANPAFDLDPGKTMAEYLRAKRIDPRKVQLTEEQKKQREQQPPPPPVQVQVEQVKGQNAMQLQQAKTQGELQQIAAEAQQEQQALQNGGASPHQVQAHARIEQEKIRAMSQAQIQQSRADAELARAEKEREIAQQNGQFKLEEMRMERELRLLDYSLKHNLTLEQVKADLAKSAMDNETKRQLGAAEIELAQNEGDKDRAIDLHKHSNPTPSLMRDEVSTPNTP
jgi:hypothetical protein